jgi:hypothetical protein
MKAEVLDQTVVDGLNKEHAAIDERAAKLRQHQTQLGYYQQKVDVANAALVAATSRRAYLSLRAAELKKLSLELWSRPADDALGRVSVDPISSLAEGYTTILACEKAVLDFSRIRDHLTANLDKAKNDLANFAQRAPK